MFKILDPTIVKERIEQKDYAQLPPYISEILDTDHIWKVTITPNVILNPVLGNPRVVISASALDRDGTLQISNNGRIPSAPVPPAEADLRPISYYAWGVGTQIFKIIFPRNTANRLEFPISFQ